MKTEINYKAMVKSSRALSNLNAVNRTFKKGSFTDYDLHDSIDLLASAQREINEAIELLAVNAGIVIN